MNQSVPAAVPVHIDSDGRLATSVTCLNCGYDLRGMEIDDGCPECGMAVRTTLRRDRLGDAPPAWLRRLRRGATAARVGTVLAPVLIGLPIATAGLWMLTTPQPGREEPASDERFRWSSRTLLLTGTLVLCGLAAAAIAAVVADPRAAFRSRWEYADIAFIAGCGLFVMGFLAATVYFGTLAERLPDKALVRATRRARAWWLAGLGALVFVALATRAADFAYLRIDLYSPYAAGAFGAVVAAILVWLWVVTLRVLGAVARGVAAAAPRWRRG